jgi:hypothetical protein
MSRSASVAVLNVQLRKRAPKAQSGSHIWPDDPSARAQFPALNISGTVAAKMNPIGVEPHRAFQARQKASNDAKK